MNGNAEIEAEREALKRIVAMLFAFAGMAERASVRSYPVRCLVLWALRRAEVVARDWLMPDGADDWQGSAPVAILYRNSQAEALHLAQSFRALAHMLKRELRLEEQLARRLMRGKANRAAAGLPRRLLKPGSRRRPATTMRVAKRCLHRLALGPALGIDTS